MLKTSEAAAALNVSPNTLRAWERRFGFPKPRRAPGKNRLYSDSEIACLRDALSEGLSIGAAISRVKELTTSDRYQLREALLHCDARQADAALDGALAMSSVEQTVAEQILPAMDAIADAEGIRSAVWGFAAMWAVDWLARARRLSPADDGGPLTVLVVGDGLSPVTIRSHALHLMLNREGVRVLMVPSSNADGAGSLIAEHMPGALILAGPMSVVDEQAWREAMQGAVLRGPLLTYGDPRESLRVGHLPSDVQEAARLVVKLFERAPSWPPFSGTGRAHTAVDVERRRI